MPNLNARLPLIQQVEPIGGVNVYLPNSLAGLAGLGSSDGKSKSSKKDDYEALYSDRRVIDNYEYTLKAQEAAFIRRATSVLSEKYNNNKTRFMENEPWFAQGIKDLNRANYELETFKSTAKHEKDKFDKMNTAVSQGNNVDDVIVQNGSVFFLNNATGEIVSQPAGTRVENMSPLTYGRYLDYRESSLSAFRSGDYEPSLQYDPYGSGAYTEYATGILDAAEKEYGKNISAEQYMKLSPAKRRNIGESLMEVAFSGLPNQAALLEGASKITNEMSPEAQKSLINMYYRQGRENETIEDFQARTNTAMVARRLGYDKPNQEIRTLPSDNSSTAQLYNDPGSQLYYPSSTDFVNLADGTFFGRDIGRENVQNFLKDINSENKTPVYTQARETVLRSNPGLSMPGREAEFESAIRTQIVNDYLAKNPSTPYESVVHNVVRKLNSLNQKGQDKNGNPINVKLFGDKYMDEYIESYVGKDGTRPKVRQEVLVANINQKDFEKSGQLYSVISDILAPSGDILTNSGLILVSANKMAFGIIAKEDGRPTTTQGMSGAAAGTKQSWKNQIFKDPETGEWTNYWDWYSKMDFEPNKLNAAEKTAIIKAQSDLGTVQMFNPTGEGYDLEDDIYVFPVFVAQPWQGTGVGYGLQRNTSEGVNVVTEERN